MADGNRPDTVDLEMTFISTALDAMRSTQSSGLEVRVGLTTALVLAWRDRDNNALARRIWDQLEHPLRTHHYQMQFAKFDGAAS